MPNVVEVAVAIVTNPNGEYLLASRPNGKGWAGWWEFPGGKIEHGEAPEVALSRELQEELGITPTKTQAWIKRRYDYPATIDDAAKTVLLHFYFVFAWQGEPDALEGQTLAWQHPQALNVSPVLPANAPIMHALSLPDVYAVNQAAAISEAAFFDALQGQLKKGLPLIKVCGKQMERAALVAFSEKVHALTKPYGARTLINVEEALAIALGFDGMHLDSQDLMRFKEKSNNLPPDFLVAASCHSEKELAHAQVINVDFVTLSLVKGHDMMHKSATFDWLRFEHLVRNIELPVYAQGTIGLLDLPQALSCGARGVAY